MKKTSLRERAKLVVDRAVLNLIDSALALSILVLSQVLSGTIALPILVIIHGIIKVLQLISAVLVTKESSDKENKDARDPPASAPPQ